MLTQEQWQRLERLPGNELVRPIWGILREAALKIHSEGRESPKLLEMIPRLRALIEHKEIDEGIRSALNQLARTTGLWNYIDLDDADASEQIVAGAATYPELDNITLHRRQLEVLDALRIGRNIILSAPTSFGKSLLIDALLLEPRFKRVAIIVPTIALLDEFRRRLSRRFGERFQIVLHSSERVVRESVIFLGTQERLIGRTDFGRLDLTVVDEFYKLDPSRRDQRHVSLNAAVYGLLNRSRQFFFVGPNIDEVTYSPDIPWDFEFIRTRTATVAVDTLDLSHVASKDEALFGATAAPENWPALVFVSAPDRANGLAAEASRRTAVSATGNEFADWLAENVGVRWPLVECVRRGYAVHHGRIPRSIASRMVAMFNRGTLPVMFCTTTLIEGVNTAAKTVMIYDHKIDGQSYDYFTFSNIRGRAGRLGQHHVGRVMLFERAPAEIQTDVAPTMFGEEEEASDDYLAQLDTEFTSFEQDDRIAALQVTLGLDEAGLKIASRLGLETAHQFKAAVDSNAAESRLLDWRGHPNKSQLKNLISVLTSVPRPQFFGAASKDQLRYLIYSLEFSASFREFLLGHDTSFRSDMKYYDSVFVFLRKCEYDLPQMLSVIEIFAKRHFPNVEYAAYIRALASWFRNPLLRHLDEEGIPIQISERFCRAGDTRASLIQRLAAAAEASDLRLTPFERDWLKTAI